MPKFPYKRIVQRFKARRGRSEDDGHSLCVRPHDSQVAGGVAKAVLLLKRGVMLFVYYENAGFRKRREKRRACPDYYAGTAVSRACPRTQALAFIKRRMQSDDRAAKAFGKPCDSLWCKSYFRDEHQALTS